MSSHHIVRDEQEPALLCWQPGQASFEQAGELLEWSPRVVVHQQALAEALQWGIKLDAVWAMPGQLEEARTAVEHQQPVSILALPEEALSLPAVLQWFKEKNQSSLHLLAKAEADEFGLLRQLEALQALVQVHVISQGWRYSYFAKGLAQKWLPAASQLRIVSFASQPALKAGNCSLLKKTESLQDVLVAQAGMVEIKSTAPFWLGEQL